MIQRLPSTLLGMTLAAGLSAQQVEWLTSEPVGFGLNPSYPHHLVSVSDNGVLASSRIVSVSMIYGQDLFGQFAIERRDPMTGLVNWTCTLSDSVTVECLVVDDSGNVYVAGKFMADMMACNGAPLAHTGQGLDVDLYLAKLDAGGILQWIRNISVAHDWAGEIPVLALDPSGQLWYSLCDFLAGELVQVDALGNDAGSRGINGAKTIGGMDFDPWGRMFVSGAASMNGITFGGQAFPNSEQYSMFVLRYDVNGQASWAEFAHDATFQEPSVACDPFGNAFVAGGLMDTTSFGNIHLNGPDWVSSTFVTKVDSTGEFLWGVESDPAGGNITGDLERSAGPCIAADDSGHVSLIGTVRGLVEWGNGVVSDGLTIGAHALSIIRFAGDGTPQWAITSLPGSGFLHAQNIAVEPSGTIYFASHLTGEFQLPPFTVNTGGQQASAFGRIAGGLNVGLPDGSPATGLEVWPVPSDGPITLRYGGLTAVPAELLDATGKRLRTLSIQPGINALDLGAAASGVYFLRMADGAVVRLVVR